VNQGSCGATHCPEKNRLSNEEEKLEGIKEWENREVEGSFRKRELVSKKRHCCKTINYKLSDNALLEITFYCNICLQLCS
jgi:hypothetical protein